MGEILAATFPGSARHTGDMRALAWSCAALTLAGALVAGPTRVQGVARVPVPVPVPVVEGEVLVAAEEPLLEVTGADLARIAWHIGNRHTPCQIEADRLLIQRDHVMADMLARIGAEVREVVEPFTPEGGAYGHGRTHGHDHGHSHGPGEDHDHHHHHAHEH